VELCATRGAVEVRGGPMTHGQWSCACEAKLCETVRSCGAVAMKETSLGGLLEGSWSLEGGFLEDSSPALRGLSEDSY